MRVAGTLAMIEYHERKGTIARWFEDRRFEMDREEQALLRNHDHLLVQRGIQRFFSANRNAEKLYGE